MNLQSSSSYTNRPIRANQTPPIVPLTEWEYEEKHAGEPPRLDFSSTSSNSEDSDLYQFSVSDDDMGTFDEDAQEDVQIKDVLDTIDSKALGTALQGDLDFLASSHFQAKEHMDQNREASKKTIEVFKYPYFHDVSLEQEKTSTQLPEISVDSFNTDFVSTDPEEKPKSKLPSTKKTTVKFDASTKASMKKKSTLGTETIPDLSISSSTIKGSSSKTQSKLKTKTLEEELGTTTLVNDILDSSGTIKKDKSKSKAQAKSVEEELGTTALVNDFINSSDKDDKFDETDEIIADFVDTGTVGIETTDLLKTIPDDRIVKPKIDEETFQRLNKSAKKIEQKEEPPEEPKIQTKYTDPIVSNPPSFYKKYGESHPPPPKKDYLDSPPKIEYKPEDIPNKTPEVYTRNSFKKPIQHEPIPDRIEYEPKPLVNNSPKFLSEPRSSRMKKDETIRWQNQTRDNYDFSDDEEAVEEFKRKKEIEKRANMMHEKSEQKEKEKKKKKDKSDSPKKISEKEKRMFYDPYETYASKLRNQRIRQKLALQHEREKIAQEEEQERLERQQMVAKQLRPELKKIADEDSKKQKKEKKIPGRFNDPESVRKIRDAVKKAENTDVLLRRNDRDLILVDIQNKRRHKEQTDTRMEENRKLDARRIAKERTMKICNK